MKIVATRIAHPSDVGVCRLCGKKKFEANSPIDVFINRNTVGALPLDAADTIVHGGIRYVRCDTDHAILLEIHGS